MTISSRVMRFRCFSQKFWEKWLIFRVAQYLESGMIRKIVLKGLVMHFQQKNIMHTELTSFLRYVISPLDYYDIKCTGPHMVVATILGQMSY